jgi:hypothetical protein
MYFIYSTVPKLAYRTDNGNYSLQWLISEAKSCTNLGYTLNRGYRELQTMQQFDYIKPALGHHAVAFIT